jgi:hypothetical protein
VIALLTSDIDHPLEAEMPHSGPGRLTRSVWGPMAAGAGLSFRLVNFRPDGLLPQLAKVFLVDHRHTDSVRYSGGKCLSLPVCGSNLEYQK